MPRSFKVHRSVLLNEIESHLREVEGHLAHTIRIPELVPLIFAAKEAVKKYQPHHHVTRVEIDDDFQFANFIRRGHPSETKRHYRATPSSQARLKAILNNANGMREIQGGGIMVDTVWVPKKPPLPLRIGVFSQVDAMYRRHGLIE